MRIVIVCGTNRTGCLSRHLCDTIAELHQGLGAEVDIIDLGQTLNADYVDPQAYKQPSAHITATVDRFLAADGVVFVVPEYNGSYPGALKLFIDMLPYPAGFDARPCAFVGLAAGRFASLRAVEHFQQVAGYRNAYNYPRRVLISDSYQKVSGSDGLHDSEVRDRLADQAGGFKEFIAAVGGQAAKAR